MIQDTDIENIQEILLKFPTQISNLGHSGIDHCWAAACSSPWCLYHKPLWRPGCKAGERAQSWWLAVAAWLTVSTPLLSFTQPLKQWSLSGPHWSPPPLPEPCGTSCRTGMAGPPLGEGRHRGTSGGTAAKGTNRARGRGAGKEVRGLPNDKRPEGKIKRHTEAPCSTFRQRYPATAAVSPA